ncbi:di-heme oxidoredictase family protein [Shimia sp.]|uniref:di-heme oxidoreductase family protein n=1 Tax=Shimia sp. TaxID=1954381 RepID=UPI00329A086C
MEQAEKLIKQIVFLGVSLHGNAGILPKWTKPTSIVSVLALAASVASANSLNNTSPKANPRTEAEIARILEATQPTTDFSQPETFESKSGGATTVPSRKDHEAFSQPSANLTLDRELDFLVGQGLFNKVWVTSPSSTKASDGLGPLYNARSCLRCHINDGRGHPPENAVDTAISMLARISVPGGETFGIPGYHPTQPHPEYGGQLQDFALAGMAPEFQLGITYEEITVHLSEGETAKLRQPAYDMSDPGYGDFGAQAMFSPRIAPQMIGLGLLEAIPTTDILAGADPDDADGDGVLGRANIVWSSEFDRPMLGRFGHKAGMPTLHEQSAAAFSGDIGISSPLFPKASGDCTASQSDCINAPHGDNDVRGNEIDQIAMDLLTLYTRNLAVPARRDTGNPLVLDGKRVFYETGCIACHTPKFVTHRLPEQPEQSFQLIWPYTDLLLHDMGAGLADNRPEAVADGQEWRTAPLWGIGLTKQVSGHTYFLHDGRARNLLEAVLWHGGEAEPQRDAVIKMPAADRAALIAFLESL